MSEDTLRSHRQPDRAIDRAIDRAVRDMMSVEPQAGLRRRVISRLDAPPRWPTLLPRFTVAAAALAAVVLAVLLLKPSPAPVAPPVAQVAQAPTSSAPAPAATPRPQSKPAQAPVAVAQTARRTMTDAPIRIPRIANVFGTPGAGVAAAAANIEDVVFPETPTTAAREDTPGIPHPISVPQITIAPLQVERIRVEPMPIRK